MTPPATAWKPSADALRVSELLRDYGELNTVNIYVEIRAANPGFTDLTTVRIVLPVSSLNASREIRVGSPRTIDTPDICESMLPALTSVTATGCVADAHFTPSGHLVVHLQQLDVAPTDATAGTSSVPSLVALELVMAGVLRGVRLDQPDLTYGLSLDVELVDHDGPVLMHLSHGQTMNLRRRIDNSEYQSLAYEMDNGRILKLIFFPSARAEVRYLFGGQRPSDLRRLVRPIMAAALGQVFMFVTLLLMHRGRADVATVPFALGLLPTIALAAPLGATLHGSRDVRVRSGANVVMTMVGVAYAVLATIEVGTILRQVPHYDDAAKVALLGAAVFCSLGSGLLFAFRYGVLPEYYCDSCGRRLWLRSRAALDARSRKSICGICVTSGVTLSGGTLSEAGNAD